MKIISLRIIEADSCGGLLDGLFISFRHENADTQKFDPICLIGPNGSGKSQLLQVVAEIFQTIFNKYTSTEERGIANEGVIFEIEYLITYNNNITHVKAERLPREKRKPEINISILDNGLWKKLTTPSEIEPFLPKKVIGYTSGANETLSLPFFSSRAGYAKEVRESALNPKQRTQTIPDPRLILIDYSTNLEVLVSNLLLNPDAINNEILTNLNLKSLHSFRCVIQLNHAEAPGKDGILLTQELETYIDNLKSIATCFDYDKRNNSYIFDFLINRSTKEGFHHYWSTGALDLYSCFHKLAMLNDLIISRTARKIFTNSIKERRFASRLPEPFDDHKVFRFERVEFLSNKTGKIVDYVSLSDGEHQLAQLLGIFCMASFPDVLFLLDEPESHFNPQWRTKFISKLMTLPINNDGDNRSKPSSASKQECLITTHSPFVPSDMSSDNVLIFQKDLTSQFVSTRKPRIETYGSTFDSILAECFGIDPPMSELPLQEINELLESNDKEKILEAMKRLGDSVEKLYLADRVRSLELER